MLGGDRDPGYTGSPCPLVTVDRVDVIEEASAPDTSAEPRRPGRTLRMVVLGAVVLLALAAGAAVGRLTAGPGSPGDESVEAGFARDMSAHHAQAVEMAMLIADRTGDPKLKILATDIALTQQEQIGRMKGWLVHWGLSPTGSRPAMAWMSGAAAHDGGHGGGGSGAHLLPDGRMPGMASEADIARLRALSGRPAEVLFLRLMVAHHRGGIPMAREAAKRADHVGTRELARAIEDGQAAEITVLQQMLRDRGQPPA